VREDILGRHKGRGNQNERRGTRKERFLGGFGVSVGDRDARKRTKATRGPKRAPPPKLLETESGNLNPHRESIIGGAEGRGKKDSKLRGLLNGSLGKEAATETQKKSADGGSVGGGEQKKVEARGGGTSGLQ